MDSVTALGLKTRIALALGAVMLVFIALTEVSISSLIGLAMSRQNGSPELARGAAALQRLVAFYLVTGAAACLALSVLAVSRLVVRPLDLVTQAVEAVSEGKLETVVPLSGGGELIRLGISFNRMTEALGAQRTELESRLDELERSGLELRQTQDRLIRAAKLASVGTLAAGLAHEIGNPLAGVLGLLDTLDEETDVATAVGYRRLMREEIRRIDRILSNLLAFARPSPADPGVPKTCELGEVLGHVQPLLKAQKLFDRIEIALDLSGSRWTIAATADELTQLLVNLLLNSAQAMEGKGRIELCASPLGDYRPPLSVVARQAVRIAVTDSGPGIPEEIAERIFDPFFTAKSSARGNGLGLAICQSICDRLGGEIAFDRTWRQGARFILTLPAG